MTPGRSEATKRYARFVALAVGVTLAVALLGYLPTKRLAGLSGVRAMLAGCSVSLGASLISAVPIALASGGPVRSVASAIMASMGLRFVLVLIAGLAAALSGWFENAPLLIWIALSYVVLLVADTRYAVRSVRTANTGEK